MAKIDLKGRVYSGFRFDIDGFVNEILREDENHIIVVGSFDELNNTKGFSGITRINISAPRSPMDLSVSLDETKGIQLTWKDSADYETGYRIFRASSNGSGFALIDSVGAGVTTYLDTNIQPGTNYTYQVVSYNDVFQSDFSDPVRVSTSQLSFPETPTELVLEDRNGNVYLTWTAASTNVSGYIIERSSDKDFIVLDTVATNNYYDQEIEINVEYQYRVKAYNVLGVSEYSPVVLYSNEVTGIEAESFEKEHPAYPNPSNSIFIIALEQPVSAENIQIVDTQGKQLSLSNVMIQQDKNQLLIDLSEEIKGVYILTINLRQKITSYRLIKR